MLPLIYLVLSGSCSGYLLTIPSDWLLVLTKTLKLLTVNIDRLASVKLSATLISVKHAGLFDLGFAYVEVGSITPEPQVGCIPSFFCYSHKMHPHLMVLYSPVTLSPVFSA